MAGLSLFANRLRLRSCALLVEDEKLLLAKQNIPTRTESVWMPPGGEVKTGESLEAALIRELKEETGLDVEVERLFYVHEFIEMPFHALEFYFVCIRTGGNMSVGMDPELGEEEQILQELKFIELSDLNDLNLYPIHIRNHFRTEFHEKPRIRYIKSSQAR